MAPHDAHPRPHPGHGSGARLWLLRHAEVHEDWRGRAYGNLDVPLSEAGIARTVELAAAFAGSLPERILSSPLSRARVLGEALAEGAGRALEVHAGLAEIDRGAWQGRTVAQLYEGCSADVRAFYADPWAWRGHGGESDAMVLERCLSPVDDALGRGAGGAVVVTTHYNVIRVLTAAALGIPPADSFALRVDPGRAVLLVDAPGGWQLHRSNAAGPALPGLETDGGGA